MRSSAVELKTVVKEMSEEFHATGNDLITVLLELEKYQKDVEKTKKVAESLRVCKEVSMFMCLAVKQIEADQHYAALHTIQILMNEAADSIAIKPLVNKLESWLPAVIDRLLVGAKRDAEVFLAFSLNSAVTVGETILRRKAASLMSRHSVKGTEDSSRNRSTADSPFVALSKLHRREQRLKDGGNTGGSGGKRGGGKGGEGEGGDEGGEKEGEGEGEGDIDGSGTALSMQYVETHNDLFRIGAWMGQGDLINIIPVNFLYLPTPRGAIMTDTISTELGALHKCLHMHVILGRSEAFISNYRALRLPVVNNFFKIAEKNMKQKQLLTIVFPNLLASVTGFFLFENVFQHCAVHKCGPFSNAELTALWDDFCNECDKFLSRHLSKVSKPEEILLLKEDLLLFVETTSDAIFYSRSSTQGRESNKVLAVLSNIWNTFEAIQVKATTARCQNALNNCQYESLYIDTEQQYLTLIKAYHIETLMDDEGRDNNIGRDTSGLSAGTPGPPLNGPTGLKSGTDTAKSEMNNSMFRIHNDERLNNTAGSGNNATGGSGGGNGGGGGSGGEDRAGSGSGISGSAFRPHASMGAAAAALDALEEDLDKGFTSRTVSTRQAQGGTGEEKEKDKERDKDNDRERENHKEKDKGAFVPVTYPFSSAIPGILKQMHLLILRFFLFSVKNPMLGLKGEAVCTAVMKVFRALNSSFKEELEKGGDRTPLSKACQVTHTHCFYFLSFLVFGSWVLD